MTLTANPQHEITFQELTAMIKEKADKYNLSSAEVLAIAANMVGKIIALQDQRHMSRDRAMRILAHNLQIGNQQAIDELSKSKGSA